MQMNKRWLFALTAVVALALAGGVASALGNSGKASAGQTFVYAVSGVPSTLDTWPYGGDPTRTLDFALDSTLMDYDSSHLKGNGCLQLARSNNLKGNLVSSWKVSKDRKTITLVLKKTKSAWGNPLTAADVKWSLERSLATMPVVPFTLSTIAHFDTDHLATVVNPRTVQIHVRDPTSYDLASLTNSLLIIWDSTEAKKHATADDPWAKAWLTNNLADFGPWKLQSYAPGSQLTLVPNPYYKANKRGNITQVVLKAVPDASVRAQLLQSGDVDAAYRLNYDQYATVRNSSGVKVLNCVSGNRDELILQQNDPALADARVRQAISLAIDRKALANSAYVGFGRPSRFGFSQYYTFPQPKKDQQLRYDPAQARKLLAQAGKENLTINLLYSTARPGPVVSQSSILIQSMLQAVGIKVNLRQVAAPADFFTAYNSGNYEAILYSQNTVVADPTFNLTATFVSSSPNNTFHYKSSSFDSTLERAKSLPEGAKRQQVLKTLSTMMVDDLPEIGLVDTNLAYAFRNNITGFNARPGGEFVPRELSKK